MHSSFVCSFNARCKFQPAHCEAFQRTLNSKLSAAATQSTYSATYVTNVEGTYEPPSKRQRANANALYDWIVVRRKSIMGYCEHLTSFLKLTLMLPYQVKYVQQFLRSGQCVLEEFGAHVHSVRAFLRAFIVSRTYLLALYRSSKQTLRLTCDS